MSNGLDDYEAQIPNLVIYGYRSASPADPHYNCIAWAAAETGRHWWPRVNEGDVSHWPDGVPHEETIEAFCQAFETLGYIRGHRSGSPRRIERVAIFGSARTGEPTHAARQLANGRWTSKLGLHGIDIEHRCVEAVAGNEWWLSFGFVRATLWRERDGSPKVVSANPSRE